MTPTRLAVLKYIDFYKWTRGYAPTQHEIAEALNLHPSKVAGDLRVLKRMGYISSNRSWRGIKILRIPGQEVYDQR